MKPNEAARKMVGEVNSYIKQLEEEIKDLKEQLNPPEPTGWHCPDCGMLEPVQVTYNETCTECGGHVQYIDSEE